MADNRLHIIDFDDSPFSYEKQIKSSKYNDVVNSLKAGVLRSINRFRTLLSKQTQFNKALVAENEFLASKIVEMTIPLPETVKTALVTGYDTPVSANSSNYSIDRLTGAVSVLSQKKWSKVARITDANGKRVASKDVYITLNGVAKPHSDDIYNILDGNRDSFWLLDTTAGTQHTITIQLPSSIRPHVNYFSLTPFPAFGFDLDQVLITQADNTIIDITPGGYQAAAMNGVGVHFKPLSWGNTITIKLTARGKVIGISDLDIFLVDYVDSYAEVRYEVPAFKNSAFTNIDQVDLMDYGLFGISDKDGIYDRFKEITVTAYVNGNGTQIGERTLRGLEATQLGTAKSIGDTFHISVRFKKYLGQSPVFRSLKIIYQ